MFFITNHNRNKNAIRNIYDGRRENLFKKYEIEDNNIIKRFISIERISDLWSVYDMIFRNEEINQDIVNFPNEYSFFILKSIALKVLNFHENYPKSKSSLYIEYIEYGLYPSELNEIMRTLVFLNNIGCDIYLTTESPYTFMYLNNLIYVNKLFEKGCDKKELCKVIAEEYWLKGEIRCIYQSETEYIDMIDKETSLIDISCFETQKETILEQIEELDNL